MRLAMKSILLLMMRAVAVCALAAIMAAGPSALAAPSYPSGSRAAQEKDKSKDQKPQISEGEQKALTKIETAPDMAAKVQAITEYASKYPKSAQRAKVISYSLGEINK